MSATNRTTLPQIDKMTKEEVQAIPLDHLRLLVEDLKAKAAIHKARSEKLYAEMDRRFSLPAIAQRRSENKDTGTVHIEVAGQKIKCDLQKKTDWDQKEMIKGVAEVQSWVDADITEYVEIKYSIPEARFTAWPSPIKAVFAKARTVKAGKPTYEFTGDAV